MKRWLKQMIEAATARPGDRFHPCNRHQVIPDLIPDREPDAGPEDYRRLQRPWLGGELKGLVVPEVPAKPMLSPQKHYCPAKFLRLAPHQPGALCEAGAGRGGSVRLMLKLGRTRFHLLSWPD